jgi:photosystem II stability/assembly factor-like uncharacterized protein
MVSLSALALANGRFPRSLQLAEDPRDPNHLYLSGTYGLLRTTDGGGTWRFVCESSFALNSLFVGDPLLAFAEDRSILVDVQTSLNLSRDDGCRWTPVLAMNQARVLDFAVAKSLPSTVVALVGNYEAVPVHRLHASEDNGATWTVHGDPLPLDSAYTIDVDPQDAGHLYATGLKNGQGSLLVSFDTGTTWTAHAIPDADADHVPYLAAIHPSDSQKIYVRTDGQVPDAVPLASDALLYSADGGQTWSQPIANGAKMLGFALSPDGNAMLVGYGDPGVGGKVTGGMGIYRSPTDTLSFTRVLEANVSCLTWTARGIYVCAAQGSALAELFLVGSAELESGASCVTRVLRLGDVRGPVICGEGAIDCSEGWAAACPALKACGDGGASDDGSLLPICALDGGTTDGDVENDETLDAALDAESADVSAASEGGQEPLEPAVASSCTCRWVGGVGTHGGWALMLTALAVIRRRRLNWLFADMT